MMIDDSFDHQPVGDLYDAINSNCYLFRTLKLSHHRQEVSRHVTQVWVPGAVPGPCFGARGLYWRVYHVPTIRKTEVNIPVSQLEVPMAYPFLRFQDQNFRTGYALDNKIKLSIRFEKKKEKSGPASSWPT